MCVSPARKGRVFGPENNERRGRDTTLHPTRGNHADTYLNVY